jgi:hypothetical protein
MMKVECKSIGARIIYKNSVNERIPRNCWVVGNESYASQHNHNETRGSIISFTNNRLNESDKM